MRFLLFMCLWLCVACKASVRAPISDLHAITDGRVTLGVVASENEAGLQAYRLLLCKKFAVYHAANFTDQTKCMPALLDADGQEVVIFHNSLRRSFAAKVGNYAKIAAGVAIVAGAVYGGHKWLARRSYRKLASVAEQVPDSLHALHQDHRATVQLLKKHLDDMGIDNKELNEAIEAADPGMLEKILKEFDIRDTEVPGIIGVPVGNWVVYIPPRAGDYLKDRLLEGRIDAKMLDDFAERLRKVDEVYAQELKALKKARQPITDTDLHYFFHKFDSTNKLFDQNIKPKIDRVRDRNINMKLNNMEKLILSEQLMAAKNLEDTMSLVASEAELDLLLKLKHKKIDAEQIRNEIARLTKEGKGAEAYEAFDDKLNEFNHRMHGYTRMYDHDIENIFDDKQFDRYSSFVKGYADLVPSVNKNLVTDVIRGIRLNAYQEVSSRLDIYKDLAELDNSIEISSESIGFTSAHILKRDVDSVKFSLPGKIWDKLKDASKLDRYDEEGRYAAIEEEIGKFASIIEQGDTHRLNFLQEIQEDSAAKMQKALDLLKNNERAAFDQFMQEQENAQQMEMMSRIFAGAAGVGAATVMLTLDKSIWGHGKRQLGDYWSQIFSTQASFAEAAAVDDMHAVLYKLAEVLGYKVNAAALQLAQ